MATAKSWRGMANGTTGRERVTEKSLVLPTNDCGPWVKEYCHDRAKLEKAFVVQKQLLDERVYAGAIIERGVILKTGRRLTLLGVVPVPPLASQSADPGRGKGANGAPGSLVASIY
jgi:hypothetical protein